MGKVAATYNIKLESPEVDIEKVKNGINAALGEECEIKNMEEVPLAFGLKMIKLLILFDDKAKSSVDVEGKLSEMPGIESIEAGDVTLL